MEKGNDDDNDDGTEDVDLEFAIQKAGKGLRGHAPGPTLLPGPVASAVSFATRSSSFALRVGTFLGGYGLNAAKVTTLSSLELSRGILEGILGRAAKDVLGRSRSELGRADTETILERSLEAIHRTMSSVIFFTASGFHLTGTAISNISQGSDIFLTILDQLFGSTDSSRAIASIITLIRREFQNPATGVPGEKVGVVDILFGMWGLAYLQIWCRKMIQEEARRLGQEEIIWDVVVLDDGDRVDLHVNALYGEQRGKYRQTEGPSGNGDFVDAIKRYGAKRGNDEDEDELPEIQMRRKIAKSLPKDAKVSISTSTTVTKFITVDIEGVSEMPNLSLPGLEVMESEVSKTEDHAPSTTNEDELLNYRVVYKMSRNKIRSTSVDSEDEIDVQSHVEEVEDDEPGSTTNHGIEDLEIPPPVPPKAARPTVASAAKGRPSSGNEDATTPLRIAPNNPSDHTRRPSGEHATMTQSQKLRTEVAANQKRTRKPLDGPQRRSNNPRILAPSTSKLPTKKPDSKTRSIQKKTGIMAVLKNPSVPSLASFLGRDSNFDEQPTSSKSMRAPKILGASSKSSQTRIPVRSNRTPNLIVNRQAPREHQWVLPSYFSSKDLGDISDNVNSYRSPFRADYEDFSGQRKRDSVVSLMDTFSVHSYESRPSSPIRTRTDRDPNPRFSDSTAGGLSLNLNSQRQGHIRSRSQQATYSPSIYTLGTRDSQTSLAMSSIPRKSAYTNSNSVDTLRRTGRVGGLFPESHILKNITRYSRYASAIYGSHFLKLMKISKDFPTHDLRDETHEDVRSFAHHTGLPNASILLASFVDPQGGSDSTGSTDTGIPLVHTIAVDEESKAVVLSCRGTLGFEDVLTDMMCDYDDLYWRGRPFKVHKGCHASARRLLYGGDGRVIVTLKEALEEFPDYGLVLCGHSLGGSVTALLGAMLAEPAAVGTAFVTSAEQHKRLLTDGHSNEQPSHICLPSGHPIHVYTYGPAAVMSPSFQKATRGLITSVVNGNDIVPHLSLGVLHDFQALSLAFKSDNHEAKAEIGRHMFGVLQSAFADKWYNNAPPKHPSEQEDEWAYAALKTLRASMMSVKLLPPGEVFAIETTPALRRDAFLSEHEQGQLGAPATRIVLKYVRDVEARFREIRFGASMLLDHSPGRYEDALRRLTLGVVEM